MLYYIFNTEQEAAAAEQKITNNVQQWVEANVPQALSEDGQKLRGRNAATGELVDVYTTRWAEPFQTTTGHWVFEKPTEAKTAPIPVGVFLAGVVADETEFDPAWIAVDLE